MPEAGDRLGYRFTICKGRRRSTAMNTPPPVPRFTSFHGLNFLFLCAVGYYSIPKISQAVNMVYAAELGRWQLLPV